MPRGTLAQRVEAYLTDSLVLNRHQGGKTFDDLDAQSALVDRFPSGRLLSIGAGLTGQSDSVPVYFEPDADVKVGDRFSVSGTRYRVLYVSPPAGVPGRGDSLMISWCTANKPHGGGGT